MMDTLILIKNLMLIAEIIAAISGSIFYFKFKESKIIKILVIALWLIALTESLGWVMNKYKILLYQNKYSYWLYNLMFPTWKTIYLLIYYKTLNSLHLKQVVKFFIIFYLISLPINWIFIQDFLTEVESIPYILSSFFISISTIFYLIELLQSEKIITFHRKLMFWISIGLLIFYAGTTPFVIVRDFYVKLNYLHNLFLIIYLLGITMYLLFTFGFIWSKKE